MQTRRLPAAGRYRSGGRFTLGGDAVRLYADLAKYWPLLSPPSEYAEEAAELLPVLLAATQPGPRTLLELGSGGGSLAFHLKPHFGLTLTDLSPQMLAVSRAVNPECEHLVGDMRSLRLGREFDAVLVHDAIMYATAAEEVRATVATAAAHCRAGGAVVLLPDCVRETFVADTSSGGHDGPDGVALRYLEWSYDPDPSDDTFESVYSVVVRGPDGVHSAVDVHRFGLFSRASWLEWIREAGFEPSTRLDSFNRDVLVGRGYRQ